MLQKLVYTFRTLVNNIPKVCTSFCSIFHIIFSMSSVKTDMLWCRQKPMNFIKEKVIFCLAHDEVVD